YRRLAGLADFAGVFAEFSSLRLDASPVEIPIEGALAHEWAVIGDAPGFAACLVGGEAAEPGRTFEAVWTMDGAVVRRAAQVGAGLAARSAPEWSASLLALLAERPLAMESPAPGLTALTNRMVGYLDAV